MNSELLTLGVTSDEQEFRDLERDWNRLASHNPMISWDWMYSWWQAYRDGKELLIILVFDSDESLIGIAPWFKTVTRGGSRVIRSLGTGNACTDYLSMVCCEDDRKRVESFVAESIFRSAALKHRIARWDLIELEGHSDGEYSSFAESMKKFGCSQYRQELESSWVADIFGPFDEFESTLKRSFRRKTRKAKKNLANPRIQFDVIDRQDELQQNWASFCELHQARRKMLGQPGCFADPEFESFLFEATRRLMNNRQARLARVRADERDIGFVLAFKSEDTYFKYQSGMSPDASAWEPGHLRTTGLVRYAIEENCQHYDFLRGNEPYKRFWNTAPRRLYRTRLIAPRTTSKIRHQLWLAGKTIKQRFQSKRNENKSGLEQPVQGASG